MWVLVQDTELPLPQDAKTAKIRTLWSPFSIVQARQQSELERENQRKLRRYKQCVWLRGNIDLVEGHQVVVEYSETDNMTRIRFLFGEEKTAANFGYAVVRHDFTTVHLICLPKRDANSLVCGKPLPSPPLPLSLSPTPLSSSLPHITWGTYSAHTHHSTTPPHNSISRTVLTWGVQTLHALLWGVGSASVESVVCGEGEGEGGGALGLQRRVVGLQRVVVGASVLPACLFRGRIGLPERAIFLRAKVQAVPVPRKFAVPSEGENNNNNNNDNVSTVRRGNTQVVSGFSAALDFNRLNWQPLPMRETSRITGPQIFMPTRRCTLPSQSSLLRCVFRLETPGEVATCRKSLRLNLEVRHVVQVWVNGVCVGGGGGVGGGASESRLGNYNNNNAGNNDAEGNDENDGVNVRGVINGSGLSSSDVSVVSLHLGAGVIEGANEMWILVQSLGGGDCSGGVGGGHPQEKHGMLFWSVTLAWVVQRMHWDEAKPPTKLGNDKDCDCCNTVGSEHDLLRFAHFDPECVAECDVPLVVTPPPFGEHSAVVRAAGGRAVEMCGDSLLRLEVQHFASNPITLHVVKFVPEFGLRPFEENDGNETDASTVTSDAASENNDHNNNDNDDDNNNNHTQSNETQSTNTNNNNKNNNARTSTEPQQPHTTHPKTCGVRVPLRLHVRGNHAMLAWLNGSFVGTYHGQLGPQHDFFLTDSIVRWGETNTLVMAAFGWEDTVMNVSLMPYFVRSSTGCVDDQEGRLFYVVSSTLRLERE